MHARRDPELLNGRASRRRLEPERRFVRAEGESESDAKRRVAIAGGRVSARTLQLPRTAAQSRLLRLPFLRVRFGRCSSGRNDWEMKRMEKFVLTVERIENINLNSLSHELGDCPYIKIPGLSPSWCTIC